MDHLFIGYDKEFHDAIPYVKVEPGPNEDPYPQRWAIEPSFVGIASKLLFQKNNAKVYEEYGLPDDDEIRGFILGHPQLMFYAPELKKIWDLLEKASSFLKLLQNQWLLTATMKTLHFSEPAYIALKLFREAVGTDVFTNVLISEEDEGYLLLNTAEYFWSKNEDAKEHAFELLKNKPFTDALYEIVSGPRYSTPVYGLIRHGDDRVIGEYSFERIGSERTSDELTELFSVPLKEFFFNLYFETMKHFAVYNKQKTPVALLKIEDGTLNEIVTDWDVSLTENGLLTAILNWLLDVGYSMGKDTLKEEGMSKAKRGVFWLIDEELLCFPFIENAEYGVAKSGNTYNHKLLWEHVRPKGCNKPYNYYPRGRVEIDAKGRPVVFMSPHIDAVYIPEIMAAFSLLDEPRVIIDGSRHYSSHFDHETMQTKMS